MKRIGTFLLAALLIGSMTSLAGNWQYSRVFTKNAPGAHGATVTPDGKVWVGCNLNTGDSLGTRAIKDCIIYNPDGTEFKRIKNVVTGATDDTLRQGCRGVTRSLDGNVLYSEGSRGIKINYQTYAGMGRFDFAGGNSCTQMAETEAGEVIVGPVLNGLPIQLFTSGLVLVGNLVDTTQQIARHVAVTPDGNDIFLGSTTGPGVIRYHSDNGTLGPYAVADTQLPGAIVETMTWRKGKLWISSRNNNSNPNLTANSWYEYDVVTHVISDSLTWNSDSTTGIKLGTPRGIAFSNGGDTAYAVGFDGGGVEMFTRKLTGVEEVKNVVPTSYALSQNYPNPFNPTTEIEFTVPKGGMVSLKVFDVLGREVATLVNENLAPGTFKTKFNASSSPRDLCLPAG